MRNPQLAENILINTHTIKSNFFSYGEKPYQNHIEQSSNKKRDRLKFSIKPKRSSTKKLQRGQKIV
jgi:hypothetical protein